MSERAIGDGRPRWRFRVSSILLVALAWWWASPFTLRHARLVQRVGAFMSRPFGAATQSWDAKSQLRRLPPGQSVQRARRGEVGEVRLEHGRGVTVLHGEVDARVVGAFQRDGGR